MTLNSRISVERVRRSLAIVAGLALALALLPLAGTVHAQDPPPNDPCPEGTPEAEFVDRDTARSTHVLSIDCVAFHAISVGASDDDGDTFYVPAGVVNRAQMATFIANTLDAAGFDLPDGDGEDEFDDIDDTVHRERINSVARAGIVQGRTEDSYLPNQQVTRAQMATFIVQAAEWAFEEDYEADGGPYFADAVDTTHEDNINAGFELELFGGRVAPTEDTLGTFDTRSGTRRDQMATFLSRLLDFTWTAEPAPQGIAGTVTEEDDDNGGPIEGATVTAFDDQGDVVETTDTDADGGYVLDLDVGTYDLTADADGYDEATADDVPVVEDQVTDQDFALVAEPAPQGIAGTVTEEDDDNGGPIEGATVTAVDGDGETDSTTTDADGAYELDLDVGTYDVTADAEGYVEVITNDVDVTADTVTDLDFSLPVEPAQGIAGTVTEDDADNGGPIEGATVTALDDQGGVVETTDTDADGQYSLDLEVGTYDVTADAEGYVEATEVDVDVLEGEVTEGIDFALTLVTGTITGTVTVDDPENGDAIEDATITVLDAGDEVVASTTTDATGGFSIEVPVGTFSVTAEATDFDTDTANNIEVEADAETTVDFQLAPAFVSPFSGTLTADTETAAASDEADPSNDAPSRGDVNVELVVEDDEGETVPTSGRDYTFTVENTGSADVEACVRCQTEEPRTIAPGATEVFENEPGRERVRVDAAAATSVEVTGETTVLGEPVSDGPVTVEWFDVDEAPTGAGAEASFEGTVAAFDTDEDAPWYLIETTADGNVFVEYTGGDADTYLLDGAPAADLDAFEAALEVGATVNYDTDADNNQTHDVTPL